MLALAAFLIYSLYSYAFLLALFILSIFFSLNPGEASANASSTVFSLRFFLKERISGDFPVESSDYSPPSTFFFFLYLFGLCYLLPSLSKFVFDLFKLNLFLTYY